MTFQLMIAINSKQQQIRERKRYGRDEERGRETSKMHERSTVCVCACAPLLIVTGAVTSCVKWCVCDTVWFSSAALWYKYRSHSGVEISFVSSAQRESSPLFRSTEKTQFSLFFFCWYSTEIAINRSLDYNSSVFNQKLEEEKKSAKINKKCLVHFSWIRCSTITRISASASMCHKHRRHSKDTRCSSIHHTIWAAICSRWAFSSNNISMPCNISCNTNRLLLLRKRLWRRYPFRDNVKSRHHTSHRISWITIRRPLRPHCRQSLSTNNRR